MLCQEYIGVEVSPHYLLIYSSFLQLLKAEMRINPCIEDKDINFAHLVDHLLNELPALGIYLLALWLFIEVPCYTFYFSFPEGLTHLLAFLKPLHIATCDDKCGGVLGKLQG